MSQSIPISGVPVEEQRLIFAGRQLADERTLSQCSVERGTHCTAATHHSLCAVIFAASEAVSNEGFLFYRLHSSPSNASAWRHHRTVPADLGKEIQPGQDDLQEVCLPLLLCTCLLRTIAPQCLADLLFFQQL